ncbi:methylglyoxal reductase (NADPH-dependent) gre2, partial [Pseudocyphellaria aurata]|nr:methylglyoxal reductase (NADPH-dependent) gre2 [Pseudocyphellaria aurata]
CVLPKLLGPYHSVVLYTGEQIRKRIGHFYSGGARKACPSTNAHYFVDVRDAALSFVLAAEKEEAAGERLVIAADKFCNKQIVEIIADEFPYMRDRLPTGEALKNGDFPAEGIPEIDNRRSVEVLGMTYRSLRESVVDNINRLQSKNRFGISSAQPRGWSPKQSSHKPGIWPPQRPSPPRPVESPTLALALEKLGR